MYRNKQFWDWKHFKEKLSLCFRARTTPESPVAQSQITTILTLLQKVQDNFSVMSKQLDNTHIPTSSISNITGLSPTIIQEAAIEGAFDSATTRDSEEIASALGDGHSSIANNFEVHLDTLIDTNFLLVGTDSVMGDEHSGHADQVFDESSHQIEDSVHEFDMAFDLVEDNSMGLQMPLQVTEVVSTPTWCFEIDYRGDMHSRKSNVAEDECLETNTDIVFGGSLQRNESTLQGQFANLKLVVTENSVFHETLSSNFDAPIRVDGEISLIPRDDEDEIAESYPSLFNQRRKCGDHLSATDFDKNDYLPIIGAQGGNVQLFAIMCSSCYSSGDDSKTDCEGAAHNWLLDVLASYILAKESGNSKVHQVFDTISNEAWKVSNVMFTLLLVGVLVETPKETRTVQQLHLTDKEYLFITFGGREPIVSPSQSTHALPMRYLDANSPCSGFSRHKIDLVASDKMYADIIFLKLTIIEDLYLDKLLFENKGGVSKSEIQSYDVRNDVKQEKFNEGIRHAECFFSMDAGVNLFIVKVGGTVKVNCVWDPGITSKTMHQNGLMETTEAHLLLEFIDITS
ncbi:hypothetical protein H5410_016028 [Solanum commersonii]|uniref:Uncharacterized protein n=1 Tax=Solanum commersonii TaxID=4109 RepID=A0A9J5ZW51_SOLCO|nr:hypothetical protein H5410_016028 [Solanum commersonii]